MWGVRPGGLCTQYSWPIRALLVLRINAHAKLESPSEGMVLCACTVRGSQCEHVIRTQAGAIAMALWMRCACANNIDQTAQSIMNSN